MLTDIESQENQNDTIELIHKPLRPLINIPLQESLKIHEQRNTQVIRQLTMIQQHLLTLLKIVGECVQILGGTKIDVNLDGKPEDKMDSDNDNSEKSSEYDAQDSFQEKFQEYVELISAIQTLLRCSFRDLSDLGILSSIGKTIPYKVTLREEAAPLKSMFFILSDILNAISNYQISN